MDDMYLGWMSYTIFDSTKGPGSGYFLSHEMTLEPGVSRPSDVFELLHKTALNGVRRDDPNATISVVGWGFMPNSPIC